MCQGCGQRKSCLQLYRQIGRLKGPSVVSMVIVAFLLPMALFIAMIATIDRLLAKTATAKELSTAISFIAALAVTFIFILAIKKISKLAGKNK